MARAALKALSREVMEPEEIFELIEEIADESDHIEAVMGSTFLDDALKRAMLAQMQQDTLSDTQISQLFDANGPLAAFSARIQVAFALGIIGREARANLDCIRDIRNAFAHQKRRLQFSHPAVAQACLTLSPPAGLAAARTDIKDWPPQDPRTRFRATVRLTWLMLLQASDRDGLIPLP